MINSLTVFGGRDAATVRHGQEYMAGLRGALAAALGRAARDGEIEAGSVETRGNLLLGLFLGIRPRPFRGRSRGLGAA